MPAWDDNPNIRPYIDNPWAYLRARVDGQMKHRARPSAAKHAQPPPGLGWQRVRRAMLKYNRHLIQRVPWDRPPIAKIVNFKVNRNSARKSNLFRHARSWSILDPFSFHCRISPAWMAATVHNQEDAGCGS